MAELTINASDITEALKHNIEDFDSEVSPRAGRSHP